MAFIYQGVEELDEKQDKSDEMPEQHTEIASESAQMKPNYSIAIRYRLNNQMVDSQINDGERLWIGSNESCKI